MMSAILSPLLYWVLSVLRISVKPGEIAMDASAINSISSDSSNGLITFSGSGRKERLYDITFTYCMESPSPGLVLDILPDGTQSR